MNKKVIQRNLCDINRVKRTNIPEVVFARGKDDKTLIEAVSQLLKANGKVLLTKCSAKQISLLKQVFNGKFVRCDSISGIVIISETKGNRYRPTASVAILAAGASDYFVAEEAAITLEFFGIRVHRYYDCGIAGVHRLVLPVKEVERKRVDVVVVVAGMEGALPSIVAGLVRQPVIAVPTSVGYGSSFNGLAALLTMLNSCSPGICVVNIDNGFGAAACAYKMIKWLKNHKTVQ